MKRVDTIPTWTLPEHLLKERLDVLALPGLLEMNSMSNTSKLTARVGWSVVDSALVFLDADADDVVPKRVCWWTSCFHLEI